MSKALKHLSIAAVTVGMLAASKTGTIAQGSPGPGQMMHDWGWGWGAMWLGPLFMVGWLALLIAVIVLLVRWLNGGSGSRSVSTRTAQDILDERYARGEIDRDEYLQRQKDIAGE